MDTQLLLEVMTHKNAKMETRLELLKDAVLEIAVVECYYRKRPDASLKDFRRFTSQILSNNALGSFLFSLGFDDAIFVSDPDFKMSLKNGAARANQFKPSKETGWDGLNLDKVFGDALEALIGAVFVDGEFAMEPVQEILRQILVPFIDRSGLECLTFASCSAAMTSSTAALPTE
ncbi:Endoribonuclease Dicer, partial [Entomortierella chlamydospora]